MSMSSAAVPLDVYVREAARPSAVDAVVDFGQSIKDMASTNIFPGDLLPKNFGVTRHGRVVFYDYDELSALTDINFRELPEACDEIEELGWSRGSRWGTTMSSPR